MGVAEKLAHLETPGLTFSARRGVVSAFGALETGEESDVTPWMDSLSIF